MVTQQTAMRRLAEKIRLGKTRLNIREQIDSNKIEITEDFIGSAEGRVVEGRIDVRINGESIGYFYYGTGRKGARDFASRTLAFQAIKKQLPDYSYFLK
jgi:hypothetical protein